MTWLLATIKGRLLLVLVGFLSLSHLLGLWLYVKNSEAGTTLLHDALLAEQIALLTRLADRLPASERRLLLGALSGPTLRITETRAAALPETLPEGSRAHSFEHFLGIFLDRPSHEGIRLATSTDTRKSWPRNLLAWVQGAGYTHADHLPAGPLAEIKPVGTVAAEVALSDGAWLRFDTPLLTVTPFSFPKLGTPLAAMLASVLLVAAWVVHRSTQPLSRFAAATERLGTNIHAPPLDERGPLEVSAAARTFNQMQERIRRLVEDRTAFAAAIAHDLGTPITRLHLRAHEIEDEGVREMVLSDLDQMRRMITATLGFARSDFTTEAPESLDLVSLVQSVGDDLVDLGYDVSIDGPAQLRVRSRPLALRRVVSNLIENAIKYGLRARVYLSVSDHGVEIHITDDGPGIPEHLQEEAFRPFRRLNANASGIQGSGLGLSVSRSITRALGGDVLLANRKEGGLWVTVALPKTIAQGGAESTLASRGRNREDARLAGGQPNL